MTVLNATLRRDSPSQFLYKQHSSQRPLGTEPREDPDSGLSPCMELLKSLIMMRMIEKYMVNSLLGCSSRKDVPEGGAYDCLLYGCLPPVLAAPRATGSQNTLYE